MVKNLAKLAKIWIYWNNVALMELFKQFNYTKRALIYFFGQYLWAGLWVLIAFVSGNFINSPYLAFLDFNTVSVITYVLIVIATWPMYYFALKAGRNAYWAHGESWQNILVGLIASIIMITYAIGFIFAKIHKK